MELDYTKLIILINKALKQEGKRVTHTEVIYVCPVHKAVHNIDRKKFGIKLDTQEFNCFACGFKGRSIFKLFKKLNINKVYFDELNILLDQKVLNCDQLFKVSEDVPVKIELPKEFEPFEPYGSLNKKSIEYRMALKYIKKRKITDDDIARYNIGYCDRGIYANMIIIPSYDAAGNLNFFQGRSYIDQNKYKHKLPSFSKDIIGFECFISWKDPVILVESGFDAISIRKNAIPLFGKMLSAKLKDTIIENKVPVIICLDNDALKNTYEIWNYLENYNIKISMVKLNKDEKDPSELGFNTIYNKINNCINVNLNNSDGFKSIINLKLNQ